MSVFRLQNNTPSVYQDESRDFQLLSRAMDAIHGSIMGDISSMKNLSRPRTMYDSMLTPYASKVGFFPSRSIDAKVFRYILAAFPYIIKNKGTKKGIRQAVTAIIKAENNTYGAEGIDVDIDNESHNIVIRTTYSIYNQNALEELLKYVIPTGYSYSFSRVSTEGISEDPYTEQGTLSVLVPKYFASGVRPVSAIDDPGDAEAYIEKSFSTVESGEEPYISNAKDLYASSYSTNTVVPVAAVDANSVAEEQEEQGGEQNEE